MVLIIYPLDHTGATYIKSLSVPKPSPLPRHQQIRFSTSPPETTTLNRLLFITMVTTTICSGAKGKPTATRPTNPMQEKNTKCGLAEAVQSQVHMSTPRVQAVLRVEGSTYLRVMDRSMALAGKALLMIPLMEASCIIVTVSPIVMRALQASLLFKKYTDS